VVVCLERGADCLHTVQLMPLHPIPNTSSSLASLKPDWIYLSSRPTGLPRLSRQHAVKRIYVCITLKAKIYRVIEIKLNQLV